MPAANQRSGRARSGRDCWPVPGCIPEGWPGSASGSPWPARPGAAPTQSPAATPAARSAAGARPMPDGISRRAMPAPGPAPGPRGAHAQVAAVEGVLHREEARPFPGRQLRHPDPVPAGEHAAVVRLHVADDGKAAAVPDAVQRAIRRRSLLTGRFDVRPVDRVRLPAPTVARWSGSRTGRPPVKNGGTSTSRLHPGFGRNPEAPERGARLDQI